MRILGQRSTSTLRTLILSSVLVANFGNRSFTITIPITCKTEKENKTVETSVLLDTGAGGLFMHPRYAKQHHIRLHKLRVPITPRNVDGTENLIGKITHSTWIQTKINGRLCLEQLLICNIGSSDIIFGLPWFKEYNPSISWKTGEIKMPKHTTETIKEYYVENQRRKKETTIPIIAIDKSPRKEMSPRRCREEEQLTSSPTLHVNTNQRESDENPNWRKKFVRNEEETKPDWRQRFKKMEEEVRELTRTCENKKTRRPKPTIEDEIDEETHKNHTQNPLPNDEATLLQAIETDTDDEDEILLAYVQSENIADLWVNKTNIATELAKKDAEKKETKTLEEMVPPELLEYKAVFDEVEASRFPESRP